MSDNNVYVYNIAFRFAFTRIEKLLVGNFLLSFSVGMQMYIHTVTHSHTLIVT